MKKTQTFLGSLYPWAFLGLSKKLPQFNSGFMLWESQHQEYSKQDENAVLVWALLLGRRMAAAASQMMAQRKQSASPCGEYLEHMLGAACKHLWLSQADQQCSAYTSSTAGSRRLWHEASLALLLLSEVIILIHFMDHHFCSSAGPTCWPQEQSSVGTHRTVPLLLLHFFLDLSPSYLHFQSCCCLYLLLSQSGFRCPSCLPGQGFLAHNPWHFFGQTWQKYQRSISCCALVFFPRWLLSSVPWRQTRKCPNYRELCKEFIFFNMIESEKEKSCSISSDQTNPN